MANNTFFCGVTNSEHTCNIDFTLGMGIFGNFLFRSSIGFKNDYSGDEACKRGAGHGRNEDNENI